MNNYKIDSWRRFKYLSILASVSLRKCGKFSVFLIWNFLKICSSVSRVSARATWTASRPGTFKFFQNDFQVFLQTIWSFSSENNNFVPIPGSRWRRRRAARAWCSRPAPRPTWTPTWSPVPHFWFQFEILILNVLSRLNLKKCNSECFSKIQNKIVFGSLT